MLVTVQSPCDNAELAIVVTGLRREALQSPPDAR